MSIAWNDAEPPAMPKPTPLQWVRMVLRMIAAAIVTLVLILIVLMLQLVERLIPVNISHPVVRFWGRVMLWLTGIRPEVYGEPMPHGGAVVTNHGSWLDILVMLSAGDVYFVSKSEVAGWPVIGWLARQTGTVFIERRRSQAMNHQHTLRQRLEHGDRLCFFPEGTSTDTRRVLPFKSTLFAVFVTDELRDLLWIQPATLVYRAPKGQDVAFYGWWGEMDIGPHISSILALSSGGVVEVHFHEAVKATDFEDRKALARHCSDAVTGCFEARNTA
jgi:lyso-ornithine lipid O-acyltransferase